MKVIFLDIDGVLNADCDFGGRSKPNPFVVDDNGWEYAGICRTHVRYLKEIVDRTDAKIVLVSSWKSDYEKYLRNHTNKVGKYLYNKLKDFNLRIEETTLKYDNVGGSMRGCEITIYLRNHPEVDNYIILDDVVFDDYDEELLKHLYKTNEKCGLCDAEYPVYMLTGVKSQKLIDREESEKLFKDFAKKLIEPAIPKVVEPDLIIVKPTRVK